MVEQIKSPEGDYWVLRPDEPLPEEFVSDYWERVSRTLVEVFHSDGGRAAALRQKVRAAPLETQAAFYHADPLEVAADLAGRRDEPITMQEKKKYLEVEGRLDRPSWEQLRLWDNENRR
jgi:hypothetical protein